MIAARGDFTVVTEPFSDSYYFAPGRVSSRYENDPDADYRDFASALAAVHAAAESGPVFFKDMAYHVRRDISPSFLSPFRNVVLVRDPRLSLVSLYKKMPDFTLEETGFEALAELVAMLDASGEAPFVMDGEVLRADPEGVCRKLFDAIDIPFDPDALTWERGEEEHWNRWQSWFVEAAQSTQFREPEQSFDEDTLGIPHVRDALEYCDGYYQALKSRVVI